MQNGAIIAVKRFGLGARPGELATARSDPRGFVLAQLKDPHAIAIRETLLSSKGLWKEWRGFSIELKRFKMRRLAPGRLSDEYATSNPKQPTVPRNDGPEAMARVAQAVGTATPFLERLAFFWGNHFCISIRKSVLIRNLAGAYEREAIRPHVLGRFEDMLTAVLRHPVMLGYLDNDGSVGPNSVLGKKRGKGFNENLAREVLELHTLGVNGGYEQSDVINFALALTGWKSALGISETGGFKFAPGRHEPGPVTVMGKVYRQEGEEKAIAILKDLATHPKTAEHVARKLARHFVSEAAPLSLVQRMAKAFRDTGGDLLAVTKTMVEADEAWTPRLAKILPPYDLLISSSRAMQVVPDLRFVSASLSFFGQPMWGVESPAGWPDGDMAWAAPDAILERIDWAQRMVAEAREHAPDDPLGFADDVLGEALSKETRDHIGKAASKTQALAMLLVSPEFQRR